MEVAGDTAARCDRGDADDTEGVTGEGKTRRAPADRAVKETVGVRAGGRTEAADPSPEPEPEVGAAKAEAEAEAGAGAGAGAGAEGRVEAVVERDAAPPEE